MGGCRCSYRNCKSATKLNGDLHFFHYPVKHRDRCNQWIKKARRPEFFNLPDDQLRNKVICDLHFEPKYFTNILRKRLVHNAIPTMNAGCEEEVLNDNSTEFKDVQILPANDDGTIFTVDTDSMQQKSSDNEPISTYSFRNGALVPVYKEEQNDTEQVLYTIEEDDIKPISYRESTQTRSNYLFIDPNRQEQVPDSYEIVFNGSSTNSQTSYEKKSSVQSPIIMEYPRKNYISNQARASSQETMEVVYITEHVERTQSPVAVKTETESIVQLGAKSGKTTRKSNDAKVREVNKLVPPQPIRKKFINQIKMHSREIASIKKTLNASINRASKFNINKLRGRVSPTLLGALSLNLYNRKANFTKDEFDFITTLYNVSPDVYNLFIDKLHWNLPEPAVVQELLKK